MAELYYVHDPMCSWCYGFKPTLDALIKALPDDIQVKHLLGGLAPDTDKSMPTDLQQTIKSTWQRIEVKIPGTIFNYNFWDSCLPRRSTYPACRSIIAARVQGNEYDSLMTSAIQQAYYRDARNPSDDTTLISLAADLELDTTRFADDLNSSLTNAILQDEITHADRMNIHSYPGLAFCRGNSQWHIPVDYHDYSAMLDIILNLNH